MMNNKRRIVLLSIGIALILSLGGIALWLVRFHLPVVRLSKKAERFNQSFQEVMSPITHDFTGAFSFMLKDLKNPFLTIAIESEQECVAASLIKVPLLAVAFRAVEGGKLRLDDELIIQKNDITGGSGILKNEKLPKQVTLKELLEIMIAASDNTASNKLISLLGRQYINDAFKAMGLAQTALNRNIMDLSARRKGDENYTSCNDLAYLFEKIYKRELVNEQHSEMMLSFLLKQSIKDRLPKYLPEDVAVAHKTGLENSVVGDAGVVFSECSDYIICVIVNDFTSYKTAKDFIAQLSAAVYNSYKQLGP